MLLCWYGKCVKAEDMLGRRWRKGWAINRPTNNTHIHHIILYHII